MNKLENLLLRNIGKISIIFGGTIIFAWLIQYINLPTWGIIKTYFGIKELDKTIGTQYMFTTIGAIFAFWYGYKKYERDKKIEQINSLMTLSENDSYKKTIIKWFTGLKLLNEGYIDNDLFNIIESYGETNFIKHILKSQHFESINWKIAEILLISNKNKYITNFLIKMKEFWKKNKCKNGNIFIEIITIMEKNNFKK